LHRAWSGATTIQTALLVDDAERARQLVRYQQTVRSPHQWWQLARSTMRPRVVEPNPDPIPICEFLYSNAKALANGVAWLVWNWPRDEIHCLQRWQRLLELSRDALRERNLTVVTRSRPAELPSVEDNERDILGRTLYVPFSAYETIRFETMREMTLTAVAIQRFVGRAGHPPDTLDELLPQFSQELPHDWFRGQPLRYRRDDGTFTLYSVGMDGNDDGGNAGVAGERVSFWTGKDIVWPQPVQTSNAPLSSAVESRRGH